MPASGHRINGEDQVDQFDGDHRKDKSRFGTVAPAFRPFCNPLCWGGSGAGFLSPQQPQGGNQQQSAEKVLNPTEALQQFDPGEDEYSAHDDGAEDPQQKRLSLRLRAQAEGAEEEQENKE